MKPQVVKCEFCKTELATETCAFAQYTTEIGGKQYVFCCQQCAQRYQQKKGPNPKNEKR